MLIMGVDPGLAELGWGIIEIDPAGKMSCRGHGCLLSKSKTALKDRLNGIYEGLEQLASHYQVEAISMESNYFAKNVNSAMQVSRVCGIIALLAGQRGAEFCEYTPLQIKQATACYGRADKSQVQKMICLMLRMEEEINTSHAADALAAAVCHAVSRRIRQPIGGNT